MKDPNQGEGDRASARRYDAHVEKFVDDGRVPDAATEAAAFVAADPEAAAKAEAAAKQGPHKGLFERIVDKIRGHH
nr:hypothetical protein [Kofleriaceae bacterium]